MTEREGKKGLQAGGAPFRHKRRNFFIKRWMQARFIIYYLAIFLGSSAVLGLLIHRFARRAIRSEMFQGHSFTVSTWDMVRPEVLGITIAVSLFVILAGALATWLLSRKVNRSEKVVIDNINTYRSTGDEKSWAPVRYPPELQLFQTKLSASIQAHRARLEGLRRTTASHTRSIRRTIESLRGAADPEQRDAAVREIVDGCGEIKKSLDRFKLE